MSTELYSRIAKLKSKYRFFQFLACSFEIADLPTYVYAYDPKTKLEYYGYTGEAVALMHKFIRHAVAIFNTTHEPEINVTHEETFDAVCEIFADDREFQARERSIPT